MYIRLLLLIFTISAGNAALSQKALRNSAIDNRIINVEESNSRSDNSSILKKYLDYGPSTTMVKTKTSKDALGYNHEKYQQFHNNIKVEGATYTLHRYRGLATTLSGSYLQLDGQPSQPQITKAFAVEQARLSIPGESLVQHPEVNKLCELVYYYRLSDHSTHLAFKVDVYKESPLSRADVYIDAISGKVVDKVEKIHTADMQATGQSLYDGTVNLTAQSHNGQYRLRNQQRLGETYSMDNGTDYNIASDIMSNDQHFDEDPAAVQAHYGAENTFEYYQDHHQRNSFDDNGSTIKSYVHYSTDYVNAFWDGLRMTYGDGDGVNVTALVSLDVVAHEITHGVTQHSANLIYQYEPGSLNESFSDIFAEAVENFATGSNDWLIGKEIFTNGTAIRSMSNPNDYNDPDTYQGDYWYAGPSDNGGVHTNSGVQNKWFYFLSEGGSGTNDHGAAFSVDALGIGTAAQIAYRNLTVYLSTYSNLYDARLGSIQSAIDLFGEGSQEVMAVTNAWHAVGVGSNFIDSGCQSGNFNLTLTFDNYPGETSWELLDSDNNVIHSGGPYTSAPLGSTINESITLPDGNYSFKLLDTYGDGICCGYGNGNYIISLGSKEIRKGSYFKTTDVTEFCVGSTSSDATPPSPPSGLIVDAVSISSADISWSASTDNQGVAHYNIYLDNNLHGTTSTLSYTFSGLSSARTYQVSVEAVDLSGNKSTKISGSFTTQTPVDNPPSTPTALAISGVTYNSASATWGASTDDGSVVGYRVMLNGQYLTTISGTGYSFTSLQASTVYNVSIAAQDNAGQLSAPNVVQFTTYSAPDNIPPTAPENLTASQVSQNTALISWDASSDDSGILNYDIYLNDVFIANPTITEFVLSGLDASTSYSIKVRARDVNDNLSGFTELTFTTLEGPDETPPSSPGNLHAHSITKTSAGITWEASIDNKGVAGYNIFLDGSWLNFTTDVVYTLEGLTAGIIYEVEVSALDIADNESARTSHTFTTLEETNTTPTQILGSYFETGWQGWNDGGSDAFRYSGRNSVEGRFSIRLRDNSGSKSSMFTDPLALGGFNSVKIEFSFIARSMESGEDFLLEFDNGNEWVLVSQFISGEDFENNNIYHADIVLSNAEYHFTNESKFRIRCDASSNADQVFIDEVNIIGNPDIAESILQKQQSITYMGTIDIIEEQDTENLSLSISPNPVVDILTVDLDAEIIKVDIYSMDGRLVLSQGQDQSQNIDVSPLQNGIYIINVLSASGKHQKKFIKH